MRAITVLFLSIFAYACGAGTAPSSLVRNGDFEQWSRGPSADPDSWARVADLGGVERVASTQAQGYAARYTRVDANVNAFQDLADPASLVAVTCSAWVAADSALVARLVLDDGAAPSVSSWNQKTDGAEYLAVSHTKTPGATRVRLVLDVSGASPSATVPGTAASFDAVDCHTATPNLLILFRQLSTHELGAGLALNILIAITVLLGALAWYRLRRAR